MISLEQCKGCNNDFYNGRKNFGGSNRCWSAEKGVFVTRYKIHYLRLPSKEAFSKVEVPNCYYQVNGYVFQKDLPSFVKEEDIENDQINNGNSSIIK